MSDRPFILMVDAADEEEPSNRRFATLDAALRAFEALDPKWHPFAWIIEADGSINVTHMRDGQRVTQTPA